MFGLGFRGLFGFLGLAAGFCVVGVFTLVGSDDDLIIIATMPTMTAMVSRVTIRAELFEGLATCRLVAGNRIAVAGVAAVSIVLMTS